MDGKVLVEVEVPTKGASRVKVNRSPVRRKRDLRRQVRAVFFGPDDLDVVRGDPSHRRRFLDEAVVALWPLKESLLTGVRPRAAAAEPPAEGVGPARARRRAWRRGTRSWSRRAPPLIRARAEAVGRLAPPASEEFEALAGYGLACTYAPNLLERRRPGGGVPRPHRGAPARRAGPAHRRSWGRTATTSSWRSATSAPARSRRTARRGPPRSVCGSASRPRWSARSASRRSCSSTIRSRALDPRRRDQIGERLAARGGQVVISVADEADVPDAAHAEWDVRAGTVTPRSA